MSRPSPDNQASLDNPGSSPASREEKDSQVDLDNLDSPASRDSHDGLGSSPSKRTRRGRRRGRRLSGENKEVAQQDHVEPVWRVLLLGQQR